MNMYDAALTYTTIPSDSITPGMTVSTIPSIASGTTHTRFHTITRIEHYVLGGRIRMHDMHYVGGCTTFADDTVYVQ